MSFCWDNCALLVAVVLASSFLYIHGQLRLSYRLLHQVYIGDTVVGNCSCFTAIVVTFSTMSFTWRLLYLAILWQQPSPRYTILLSPQTSSSFGAIGIMCCLGAWSSSSDLFWGQEDKEKYPEAVFHVLHCTMLVCILPSQFWFSPSLFGVCKVGVADKNKSLLSTLTIIPNKETGMASDDRESLAPSFACLCHYGHTRHTSVADTKRMKIKSYERGEGNHKNYSQKSKLPTQGEMNATCP